MKVEALCSINSGRTPKGSVFGVSREEGEALLRLGAAKRVAEKQDDKAVELKDGKGKTKD